FIARLRQAKDRGEVAVGRDVVVVGGGMTAVDAAVQSKLLGAQSVTLAYRGPRERMKASTYEVDLAASKGVNILTNATPVGLTGNGALDGVTFKHSVSGEERVVMADQLLMAIGQTMADGLPATDGGKIVVTGAGRTTIDGVWAGGDCASGGDDLTVTAVAEGRDAAEDMHIFLGGSHG
ncbi:MAG: FAD-dependent oxidoreductase, partial [Pseudomonadota bacterium]